MIKLSKRLLMATRMIPSGHNVADIGADHGYLISYLIENNIANIGFAVENKIGPFEILKSNIKELSLDNKITCSLSSGISSLPKEYNVVCILGMGGETIYNILKDDEDKLSNITDLIISSHGEDELVYSYLISKGYGVLNIDACYDANKYYEVVHYKFGLKSTKYRELLIENNNDAYKIHLNDTISKNNILLKKDIPNSKKIELEKENENLKLIISKMN